MSVFCAKGVHELVDGFLTYIVVCLSYVFIDLNQFLCQTAPISVFHVIPNKHYLEIIHHVIAADFSGQIYDSNAPPISVDLE